MHICFLREKLAKSLSIMALIRMKTKTYRYPLLDVNACDLIFHNEEECIFTMEEFGKLFIWNLHKWSTLETQKTEKTTSKQCQNRVNCLPNLLKSAIHVIFSSRCKISLIALSFFCLYIVCLCLISTFWISFTNGSI